MKRRTNRMDQGEDRISEFEKKAEEAEQTNKDRDRTEQYKTTSESPRHAQWVLRKEKTDMG